MRKAIVGLLIVGLLAVSAPAMAQVPGSEDPLGLITSGFVLPYVGGGSNESWLEVYAPVSGVNLHAFFFNESCVRAGDSVGVELTTNDIAVLRIDNLGGNIPPTGLMTAASTDASGFVLSPLEAPMHARVLWADLARNKVRVLEPIALDTFDTLTFTNIFGDVLGWNPLRTAATFFAPLEVGGFSTTIYFICPNQNIAGTGTQLSTQTRAFGPGSGFPELIPSAQVAGTPTPLRIRVYDDEERFLRDVNWSCNCLTTSPVRDISSVYSDAAQVGSFGTYTEVEGGTTTATPAVCSTTEIVPLTNPPAPNAGNPCPLTAIVDGVPTGQFRLVTPGVPGGGPFAFTGYRAITAASFDVFGRLSNGWKCDIQGGPTCGAPSPNFR